MPGEIFAQTPQTPQRAHDKIKSRAQNGWQLWMSELVKFRTAKKGQRHSRARRRQAGRSKPGCAPVLSLRSPPEVLTKRKRRSEKLTKADKRGAKLITSAMRWKRRRPQYTPNTRTVKTCDGTGRISALFSRILSISRLKCFVAVKNRPAAGRRRLVERRK
jgi:hypothetical protein